jgi:hypothetical protein
LDDPSELSLEGRLVSFLGSLRGDVAFPDEYQEKPLSATTLRVKLRGELWRAKLQLKTHYVYSVTATGSLSNGRANGLVVLRSIDKIKRRGGIRVVDFSCTPLITGCGGGGPLEIPKKLILTEP